MNQLRGVLPAIVTPVDANGNLNETSYRTLLERFYERGAHGVYVCGQTGEGLQLPPEVRERATEVAVAATPQGRHVVVHVGAASTAEALRLTRHASAAGAHAVSSLPPGSAYSFQEVQAYYEALAETSNVPVLVYYFPDFSSSIRTLDQVTSLCSIPNVVGLKFTDFDLYRLSQVANSGNTIFNGRDEVFVAGMLMGACGGIGSFYNLVPELFVSIYEDALEGCWARARQSQDRANALIQAVLQFPMLPALKRLLTWSGIDCGYPVLPRRVLTGDEESALRIAVENAGFAPDRFLR
jgi:N-acetylneuraminate lyase